MTHELILTGYFDYMKDEEDGPKVFHQVIDTRQHITKMALLEKEHLGVYVTPMESAMFTEKTIERVAKTLAEVAHVLCTPYGQGISSHTHNNNRITEQVVRSAFALAERLPFDHNGKNQMVCGEVHFAKIEEDGQMRLELAVRMAILYPDSFEDYPDALEESLLQNRYGHIAVTALRIG